MEDEEILEPVDLDNVIVEELPDGGADVIFGADEPEEIAGPVDENHYANLVEDIDEDDLKDIGFLVLENYDVDKKSISEWQDNTEQALQNLGILYEEGNEPFEGACTATHPLILESCIKFQSKASNEILPTEGPVKTQILGEITDEKEEQAVRVKNVLNYQIMKQMSEYVPETEKALLSLPLIGNAFKKKYFDPNLKRCVDEYLPVERCVVNSDAPNLKNAERITCVLYRSERELRGAFASDYYVEPEDMGDPAKIEHGTVETKVREITGVIASDESRTNFYTLVEQQVYLPLDEKLNYDPEDSTKELYPYIVTVETTSEEVLAIRRNWSFGDPAHKRLDWITHYSFVPGFGFYGLGFSHLLGNLQKTLTVSMRSLVDSGQFANLQGGFKSKGLRIIGETEGPVGPGEWQNVETIGSIKDSIMPLPYKEPSQTMFMLLEYLNATGMKFADSTEQVVADSTNYGPVGTTMALLEASTKFHAAVHKRLFLAQEQELKIISRINYEFMDDIIDFDIIGKTVNISRDDFNPDIVDVIPVSDPNLSSQAQRISMAETQLHFTMQSPDIHNRKEAFKRMYQAIGVKDIDRLLPPENEPVPQDPVSDIMSALKGEPIAAFPGQDHDAHIGVKGAWLNDPEQGGSVPMQGFTEVVMSNIREHMMMKWQEELMAVGGGNPTEQILADTAQRLSRLHQIAEEEKQDGSPAKILADAEMLDAQTNRMKEERESAMAQVEQGIDIIRLFIEAEQTNTKIDNDIKAAAANLIAKGEEMALKEKTEIEKAKQKINQGNNTVN
jgi:hypothetical protein